MGNDKIKCGIYARVSTDKQGDSIENQVSQAREYIKRMGDEYDTEDILIYKDEAVSGYYTSVFDRAEMKVAIDDAKNKRIQLLVFKEVSRVGRDKQENPAIIGMFEQYGVRIVAINDNYDSLNKDNITFDILSVLSEQESRKISVRVSSARKQKAARGQWNGEAPFGYFINPETKRLEVDEDRGKIPSLVFDLYVNKGLGTFKVAEYLNQRDLLTKNGNLWSRETINRMIKNQAYIGQVAYGTRRNVLKREYDERGAMSKKKVQIKIDRKEWQIVENAHPSLIDKELFYKAQKIISSRSHERGVKRAYHPLTGLLICGQCGAGMVCQKRTHGEKSYRYYICKTYHKYGRDTCSQANVNADELEKVVIEDVKSKFTNLPYESLLLSANREDDIENLRKELKSINTRKEKLMKDQMDIFSQRDLFSEDLYRTQMIEIKNKITDSDSETSIIEKQICGIEEKLSEATSLQYIIEEFNKLDIEDVNHLRTLLREVIRKITLTKEDLHIDYIFDFNS
jgi:site-specific DNA recombinase